MKKKILIIEGDAVIQTQLKNLLSGNGYEVSSVTDFSQAIRQIQEFALHHYKHSFDVVKNFE